MWLCRCKKMWFSRLSHEPPHCLKIKLMTAHRIAPNFCAYLKVSLNKRQQNTFTVIEREMCKVSCTDLCCTGVIKCHSFRAFNQSNNPPFLKKKKKKASTLKWPLWLIITCPKIKTYPSEGRWEWSYFGITPQYSRHILTRKYGQQHETKLNTLRGDDQIKSHFAPCHFYEVTVHICSHPVKWKSSYASGPEMTVSAGFSLQIVKRDISSEVAAVIGVGSMGSK